MTAVAERKISRAEIDAKLAEIRREVDSDVAGMRNAGIAIGVASGAALLAVAFWIGRRHGKKRQAIVEIKRV